MRRLVPYALGLGVLALGFAIICGLGALWGLLFNVLDLDPAHPEKFTLGINFFRGFTCTGVLSILAFALGSLSRVIGREVMHWWESRKYK